MFAPLTGWHCEFCHNAEGKNAFATSGPCWIREKTGNEDDDGICVDDHEAGNGKGGMAVAWRKSCDATLCKAVYGGKPKTTTTTTTEATTSTKDPAVGDCDPETEYDSQPKANTAAEKLDAWCEDDKANSVLNNHLNDWPGERFKIARCARFSTQIYTRGCHWFPHLCFA
jgi:hypothetical protein